MPRLSVNINEESAAVLRRVTEHRGISTTEAIRRAIGLLSFFEDARENQVEIMTRDKDGQTSRLLQSY